MALLIIGGVMIYAGMQGDNPITVLKGVLTGGYTSPKKATVASPTIAPATPPGQFGQVITNAGK